MRTRPDVLPGVAPVLRDLAARRLARSGVTLALVSVVGVLEAFLPGGYGIPAGTAVLAGSLVAAAALVGAGWRGVRKGAGAPHRVWMTAAAAGSLAPYLLGVWLLGFAGLRRLGVGPWTVGTVALGLTSAAVGVRLLGDTLRVMEVERLGAIMATPAPEEEGSGG